MSDLLSKALTYRDQLKNDLAKVEELIASIQGLERQWSELGATVKPRHAARGSPQVRRDRGSAREGSRAAAIREAVNQAIAANGSTTAAEVVAALRLKGIGEDWSNPGSYVTNTIKRAMQAEGWMRQPGNGRWTRQPPVGGTATTGASPDDAAANGAAPG
jgi:hypothetical protein